MASNGKWGALSCEELTGTTGVTNPALKHVMQEAVVDMAKQGVQQLELSKSLPPAQRHDVESLLENSRSVVAACENKGPLTAVVKSHRFTP